MNLQNLRPYTSISLIGIGCIVIACYAPGLRGPFIFDDVHHIVSNPAVVLEKLDLVGLRNAALYNKNDPLKRPLATISFALNHYFAGGRSNTFPFKLTNLAIHLINTGLIYWLSLLLLREFSTRRGLQRVNLHPWLPGLVAATWALHPLQLTSVLYVVQRMTSLAAMFVFIGIIVFVCGRIRVQGNRPFGYTLMSAGLLGGLVLGLGFKENAALLPFFILVIEYVIFRGHTRNVHDRRRLWGFYGIAVLAPCVVALLWLLSHPDFIVRAYDFREFSLSGRLLTEPRVLWFYTSLIFYPDIRRFGLFHDDIPISTGLFDPWTTAPALIGVLLAIVIGIFSVKKYPVLSLSMLWFLVGHTMESTLIGLEIAHEHRNYLPVFGPIFGILYGMLVVSERLRRRPLGVALLLCYITILGSVTYVRANVWASEDRIIETLARSHPASARSHFILAELYAKNRGDPMQALNHYKMAYELNPREAHALIGMVMTAANTTIQGTLRQTLLDLSAPKTDIKVSSFPDFVSVSTLDERIVLKLDPAIIAKIEDRLRQNPIGLATSIALADLSDCVNREIGNCASLYHKTIEWHKLALNNPRVTRRLRADIAVNLGNLYLQHDDYELALSVTQVARKLAPYNATAALLEANAYMLLSQLDEAERIVLSEKNSSRMLSSTAQEHAKILLEAIRTRRDKEQTGKTKVKSTLDRQPKSTNRAPVTVH